MFPLPDIRGHTDLAASYLCLSLLHKPLFLNYFPSLRLTAHAFPFTLTKYASQVEEGVVAPPVGPGGGLPSLSLPSFPETQPLQRRQSLVRHSQCQLLICSPGRNPDLRLLRGSRSPLATISDSRRSGQFLEYLLHEPAWLYRALSFGPGGRACPPCPDLPQRQDSSGRHLRHLRARTHPRRLFHRRARFHWSPSVRSFRALGSAGRRRRFRKGSKDRRHIFLRFCDRRYLRSRLSPPSRLLGARAPHGILARLSHLARQLRSHRPRFFPWRANRAHLGRLGLCPHSLLLPLAAGLSLLLPCDQGFHRSSRHSHFFRRYSGSRFPSRRSRRAFAGGGGSPASPAHRRFPPPLRCAPRTGGRRRDRPLARAIHHLFPPRGPHTLQTMTFSRS